MSELREALAAIEANGIRTDQQLAEVRATLCLLLQEELPELRVFCRDGVVYLRDRAGRVVPAWAHPQALRAIAGLPKRWQRWLTDDLATFELRDRDDLALAALAGDLAEALSIASVVAYPEGGTLLIPRVMPGSRYTLAFRGTVHHLAPVPVTAERAPRVEVMLRDQRAGDRLLCELFVGGQPAAAFFRPDGASVARRALLHFVLLWGFPRPAAVRAQVTADGTLYHAEWRQ